MKKRLSILVATIVLALLGLFIANQTFACGNENGCNEFDQVATGFAEADVNKHVDNGTPDIGVNGDGYASASYETESRTEAGGSADAQSGFSYGLESGENSANIFANTKSNSSAETDTIKGSSVVGQESYAGQSNGATVVHDSQNGFSAGNQTYAETGGEKDESCGPGISISGVAEANGYTNGEMTFGDGFRKTSVETGGNSSATGPNGFVNGDGSYGGNAGIEKNGAFAYGELGGSWKYSGYQSGSGIGGGSAEATVIETEGSISATSRVQSYSSASGE